MRQKACVPPGRSGGQGTGLFLCSVFLQFVMFSDGEYGRIINMTASHFYSFFWPGTYGLRGMPALWMERRSLRMKQL